MRMAFSWTCHPNMNDPRAQRRRQRRKPRAPQGRHQRDTKAGFIIAKVTQTFRQKEKKSLSNSNDQKYDCNTLVVLALRDLL